MKVNRLYRILLLVLAGGALFQTTSCATQVTSAVVSSVSSSLSTVIESQINDAVSQLFGNSSST